MSVVLSTQISVAKEQCAQKVLLAQREGKNPVPMGFRFGGAPSSYGDCLEIYNTLRTYPHVISLEIKGCEIPQEELFYLLGRLHETSIARIVLAAMKIGDEGAALIAEQMRKKRLTKVLISWGSVTSVGAKLIADALKDSIADVLFLDHNNIGDGVVHFCQAIKWGTTTLRALCLDQNKITDDGVRAITSALPNSNLETLSLKYNLLSLEAVKSLCKAVAKTPSLRTFIIGGNTLNSIDRIRAIADMLRDSHRLERLNVEHCNLTARELPILAEGIMACPALKRFIMKRNQFLQDEHVRDFAYRIRTHPSLTEVSVVGCDILPETERYVVHVVHRMTSFTTKLLVLLYGMWTVPRLIQSYPQYRMEPGLVRLLHEAMGNDEPPPATEAIANEPAQAPAPAPAPNAHQQLAQQQQQQQQQQQARDWQVADLQRMAGGIRYDRMKRF